MSLLGVAHALRASARACNTTSWLASLSGQRGLASTALDDKKIVVEVRGDRSSNDESRGVFCTC
jgi:hypothetical protein